MITDPIHRAKLLKLARLCNFLDDLPHSKFFMPRWSSPDATEHSCGTAGCFAGWAATVYASEGWSFRLGLVEPVVGRTPSWNGNGSGVDSFGKFFGLNLCTALALTLAGLSDLYPRGVRTTPDMAAAAGRRVLNEIDPTIVPEAEGAMPPSVQARTAATHDRAYAKPEHDRALDALAQDVMGVGCGVEGGTNGH